MALDPGGRLAGELPDSVQELDRADQGGPGSVLLQEYPGSGSVHPPGPPQPGLPDFLQSDVSTTANYILG